MKNLLKSDEKGFTLIELLIVIGIIAILLAIALVAINPGEQFAKANNVRRTHDLKQILSAIQQNMIDSRGPFSCVAGDLPTSTTTCMGDSGQDPTGRCSDYYDICDCLVFDYLPQMPVDPQYGLWENCSNYNTQYTIQQASLILGAPWAELGETIGTMLPGEITVKIPSNGGNGGNGTEYEVWQSCGTGTLNSSSFNNYSMGYKFVPTIDITVTKLCGRWPSGTGDDERIVTLQNASFSVMATTSITISDGNWDCRALSSPEPLTASSIYYVSEYGTGFYMQSGAGLPKDCGGASGDDVYIESSCFQSNASGGFTSPACTITTTMYGQADIIFTY